MYENKIKEKIKAVSPLTNNPQNYGITQNSKPNNKNMKENNEKITKKNNENFFNSIISKVKNFWDSQTTQKTDINSITNNSPSDTSNHQEDNSLNDCKKFLSPKPIPKTISPATSTFKSLIEQYDGLDFTKPKMESTAMFGIKMESASMYEIKPESTAMKKPESTAMLKMESASMYEIKPESTESKINTEIETNKNDQKIFDEAKNIFSFISTNPTYFLTLINFMLNSQQQPKLESNNHETQRD